MGLSENILVSTMTILVIFNFIFASITGTGYSILLGAIIGQIAVAVSVGVIAGLEILGNGLNSMSIKVIFGVSSLANLFFSFSITNIGGTSVYEGSNLIAYSGGSNYFQVGAGLITNLLGIFPIDNGNIFSACGFLLVTIIGMSCLISSLIIIISGSSG